MWTLVVLEVTTEWTARQPRSLAGGFGANASTSSPSGAENTSGEGAGRSAARDELKIISYVSDIPGPTCMSSFKRTKSSC